MEKREQARLAGCFKVPICSLSILNHLKVSQDQVDIGGTSASLPILHKEEGHL